MDRRSFIALTAVGGTSAALAGCGHTGHELIRFLPDEDVVPGIAVWKPGVCRLCASGCGLSVRLMDADADVVRDGQAGVVRILAAKKLEGHATHPVNRGRLCARGQAGVQITYHPDRITQPLRRAGERGEGRYDAVSWEDALADVVARLDRLRAEGRPAALACLARGHEGHRGVLLDAFLERLGAPPVYAFEIFSDEVLRRANALSFGRDQLPTFDLAQARHVLSMGADFLGTWNAPVAHSEAYGAMRQARAGIRGTFVQVEARMSQTGANADEWVPIRPGTEGTLALGLAHVILASGARQASAAGRAGSQIEGWGAGLADFTPEAVETLTGVAARRIERLARDLVERSPAVVMIGGAPLAHTNGLAAALAVNALNALLGNVGQPGGVSFTPQLDVRRASGASRGPARPAGSVAALASGILAGTVPEILLVDGVNPVFAAPPAWRVRDALDRIPFIVSVGSFLDETSAMADLILPDHSFLEAWVDAVPESGATVAVASVAPPAMRPLHDTRSMPDVLLEIGRRLATPLALPWETFEEMLGTTFATLPGASEDADVWYDAQENGGWWGDLPSALAVPPVDARADSPSRVTEPQFDGDAGTYPLHFLPYASSAFLDGSLAHLPWLQEMPDPLTSAMWSSWLEINPATAAALGIAQGDVVEVTSSQGSLQTAAVITPGIAPDLVAMPMGQGHRLFTRYATGRGENPAELLAPVTEAGTGALAWAATRVRVARVGRADGRLILFAGGTHEHEHGPR